MVKQVKHVKWELRMNEARELRRRGSELLFDRVSLLVSCYEDEDFRAWHADNGTNELDFLDFELSDTAASFLTLKAVLDANPERELWAKHNIRDLIADVIELDKKPRERSVPSWKEKCLAAEKECERLRAENANLKETLVLCVGAKS
jgi:hypothetical protein